MIDDKQTSKASPDELTEEEQKNVNMHHTLALIHGFNEMVTRATTLGEKTYYRLARDTYEKKFNELGGTIDRGVPHAPVLVIPGHVPEIRFDERDIELMRQCVARFDSDSRLDKVPADEHDVRARAREICINNRLPPEFEDVLVDAFEPLLAEHKKKAMMDRDPPDFGEIARATLDDYKDVEGWTANEGWLANELEMAYEAGHTRGCDEHRSNRPQIALDDVLRTIDTEIADWDSVGEPQAAQSLRTLKLAILSLTSRSDSAMIPQGESDTEAKKPK